MVALQLVVFKTRVGTAMRAVSYNMETSGLMGIPVDRNAYSGENPNGIPG
jgi:branched-chain amino acid transport system permease protein